MLRERLIDLLTESAKKAQKEGKLPAVELPEITIERPQNAEHGDYASNFPLKLARTARANPMTIAQELVALLPEAEEIESAVAAPPGFINFTLRDKWLNRQVDRILQDGESFGNNNIGRIKKSRWNLSVLTPPARCTLPTGAAPSWQHAVQHPRRQRLSGGKRILL